MCFRLMTQCAYLNKSSVGHEMHIYTDTLTCMVFELISFFLHVLLTSLFPLGIPISLLFLI